ncbi:kelch repeat-containing protein [Rohdeia mirabilis]
MPLPLAPRPLPIPSKHVLDPVRLLGVGALLGMFAAPALAQTWADIAPVPTGGAARSFGIGLVESGEILVLAGRPWFGTNDSRVDGWTAGGGWTTHEKFEGPIIGQGVGIDDLGNIVCFGGFDGDDPEGDTASNYRYDRNEGQNVDIADRSAGAPETGFAFATDDANRVYALGGGSYSTLVERYLGSTDTWSTVASLPIGVTDAAGVNDGTGRLLVIGGRTSGSARTAVVQAYDVATNGWSTTVVPPLPEPISGARAATGADGRVYVVGGSTDALLTSPHCWALDLATNTWTQGPDMQVPRRNFAFVLGPDDFLYAIGGNDASTGTDRVERLFTSDCPIAGTAPASVEAWPGLAATMHVFFAGSGPMGFQWEKDGVPLVDGPTGTGSTISGAFTDTLVVSGVGASDVGDYRLVATNACGSDTSGAASLSLRTPPTVGTWSSVRRMDPFGISTNAASCVDGIDVYGNGQHVSPFHGNQSMGGRWNALGHFAQGLVPPNSAGSSISDAEGGRAVGWWWWPYTTPQGTGYYQHAATWDPVTHQHHDIQPSGWEIGSVSETNGTQHVGTLRYSDESTTVDGVFWKTATGSPTWLTPSVAWGSSATGLDDQHQYGSCNMGFGVVHAARWSGSAASWEDWHVPGSSRSYLHTGDGGLVIGTAYFGNDARAYLWGERSTDHVEFLPAGATAVSLSDTKGGLLLGRVTDANGTHAALWEGPQGVEIDLDALAATHGYTSVGVTDLDVEPGLVRVAGNGFGPGGAASIEPILWTFQDEPLVAHPTTVSLSNGGRHELFLAAGPARAGHIYFVVGSATGTSPAIPLGGGFSAPIVPDAYTTLTLSSFNGTQLKETLGVLGPDGGGHATLALPAGTQASLAGLTLHHAFLAWDGTGGLSFVSNAVDVDLLP